MTPKIASFAGTHPVVEQVSHLRQEVVVPQPQYERKENTQEGVATW